MLGIHAAWADRIIEAIRNPGTPMPALEWGGADLCSREPPAGFQRYRIKDAAQKSVRRIEPANDYPYVQVDEETGMRMVHTSGCGTHDGYDSD